jgi:hypothetical protein
MMVLDIGARIEVTFVAKIKGCWDRDMTKNLGSQGNILKRCVYVNCLKDAICRLFVCLLVSTSDAWVVSIC